MHIDYSMESVRVLYFRKSVLIGKQQVRKYRTKHSPCCNLFILFLLRFPPSTRFSAFIRHNECQVMFLFRLMSSTLPNLQKPSITIFGIECYLGISQRFSCVRFVSLALSSCKSFAWRFQTFLCLVKVFVVDNAHDIFKVFKTILDLGWVFARGFLFCCSWMYLLVG